MLAGFLQPVLINSYGNGLNNLYKFLTLFSKTRATKMVLQFLFSSALKSVVLEVLYYCLSHRFRLDVVFH